MADAPDLLTRLRPGPMLLLTVLVFGVSARIAQGFGGEQTLPVTAWLGVGVLLAAVVGRRALQADLAAPGPLPRRVFAVATLVGGGLAAALGLPVLAAWGALLALDLVMRAGLHPDGRLDWPMLVTLQRLASGSAAAAVALLSTGAEPTWQYEVWAAALALELAALEWALDHPAPGWRDAGLRWTTILLLTGLGTGAAALALAHAGEPRSMLSTLAMAGGGGVGVVLVRASATPALGAALGLTGLLLGGLVVTL